jgi:hypothetical protein
MSVLWQYHTVFVTLDSVVYFMKSGIVIPSALFFLLKFVLAVQGLFHFPMKFRIAFSIYVKNDIGILLGIALNL